MSNYNWWDDSVILNGDAILIVLTGLIFAVLSRKWWQRSVAALLMLAYMATQVVHIGEIETFGAGGWASRPVYWLILSVLALVVAGFAYRDHFNRWLEANTYQGVDDDE